MVKLPLFQTVLTDLSLLQNKWKSILDVLLSNPSLNCSIIYDVHLNNGTTVINHKLGQDLQGWRITRINGSATIYDKQSLNQSPDLTLILVSSAAVTVSIEVF